MFPMNDTVRKTFDSNIALGQEISAQMMEWQSTMVLTTQKQFNAFFDGYRSMLETNNKAARAMQQSMVDRVKTVETAQA